MDYYGLIGDFKINRSLTDEERTNQLKQKQRLNVDPIYQLVVTRLNSTYLESVDKYFGWKGFASFWILAVLTMLVSFVGGLALMLLIAPALPSGSDIKLYFDPNGLRQSPEFGVYFGMFLLCLPVIIFSIWALRKESFAYTHYPIRLNRKNRMVYVFRKNGSVLAAQWDDLFFTLARGPFMTSRAQLDILGHVLAADGQTVVETFAFSNGGEDKSLLLRHWEFLRRYMKEGSEESASLVKIFMGVTDKRETAKQSFYRMWINFGFGHVIGFLMLPLSILIWLGRLFAMRTSKVPVWPVEVEAACYIEPGDPFERDERNNPSDMYSFR